MISAAMGISSGPRYPETNDRLTPRMNPPRIEPKGLSSPPMTAAANP